MTQPLLQPFPSSRGSQTPGGMAPVLGRAQCLVGCVSLGWQCPFLALQPSVLLLSVAAKELYSQGNVVVPLAGVYPHIAGKERGLQGIPHCALMVLVCLENLERREKPGMHLAGIVRTGPTQTNTPWNALKKEEAQFGSLLLERNPVSMFAAQGCACCPGSGHGLWPQSSPAYLLLAILQDWAPVHAILADGDSKLLHKHLGEESFGTLGYDCSHLLGYFEVHLQPLSGAVALGKDRLPSTLQQQ